MNDSVPFYGSMTKKKKTLSMNNSFWLQIPCRRNNICCDKRLGKGIISHNSFAYDAFEIRHKNRFSFSDELVNWFRVEFDTISCFFGCSDQDKSGLIIRGSNEKRPRKCRKGWHSGNKVLFFPLSLSFYLSLSKQNDSLLDFRCHFFFTFFPKEKGFVIYFPENFLATKKSDF